jgi:DNA invertase Pin-like site-specific DNA recombinase
MKTVGFVRWSPGDKESLIAQEERILRHEEIGLVFDDVDELLTAAAGGDVETLVLTSHDRLAHDKGQLTHIVAELESNGVTIIALVKK